VTIYLDFDGTMVEHYYPNMGRCNFGSVEVVRKLQDAGHTIILNTYRADCNDGTLEKAIKWLENSWMCLKDKNSGRELLPIPLNTTAKINPAPFIIDKQLQVYNDSLDEYIFLDDQSLGMPLKPATMIKGSMVDWDAVDKILSDNNFYSSKPIES
jgi:hypothetical protein